MKYALITGASSGIGREFAIKLDQLGYTCILTARRSEQLNELNNQLINKGHIIICDLNHESEKIINYIKDYKIDIFINNAGLGYCEQFSDYDLSHDINMIDVNIKAMHILLKEVINHMKHYNEGTILNVASIAGLLKAGPYMSTYYATKAYVVSLTRGLQYELKKQKSGIYLGCLCPGPVKTEFDTQANVSFSLKGISVRQCVDAAYKGMIKKQKIIIPTLSLKLLIFLSAFVPTSLVIHMTANNQKKKIKKRGSV